MAEKLKKGRIVYYILNENDVRLIGKAKSAYINRSEDFPAGAQTYVGNPVAVGDEVPAIVVTVWPNEFGDGIPGFNGQAFLDGNFQLWLTSVREGTEPGTWHWPERE